MNFLYVHRQTAVHFVCSGGVLLVAVINSFLRNFSHDQLLDSSKQWGASCSPLSFPNLNFESLALRDIKIL